MILRTCESWFPARHWKIALCSRIHRQQRRAVRRHGSLSHHVACRNQRLLVGKRNRAALLDRGHRGRKARAANDGRASVRSYGPCDAASISAVPPSRASRCPSRPEGRASSGSSRLVGQHRHFGAELPCASRASCSRVAIGRKRNDAPFARFARDEVQRRSADRSSRAKDGDASAGLMSFRPLVRQSGSGFLSPPSTNSRPSTLSNSPPWPGSSFPESFTPCLALHPAFEEVARLGNYRQNHAPANTAKQHFVTRTGLPKGHDRDCRNRSSPMPRMSSRRPEPAPIPIMPPSQPGPRLSMG